MTLEVDALPRGGGHHFCMKERTEMLSSRIRPIETAVTSVLLAAIVVLVFLAALLRWFGMPLTWSVDLATLLFVWVGFLGADLAVQTERHIGVDLFPNTLSPRPRHLLRIAIDIAALAFVGMLCYFAIRLAVMNPHRRFPGMNISYSWATGSAAVGSILLCRSLLERIFRRAAMRDTGGAR